MLTAKEAREKAITRQKQRKQEELEKLERLINQAVEKGQTCTYWNQVLSYESIEHLKEIDYEVINYSNSKVE